jgi:hypothetical protein
MTRIRIIIPAATIELTKLYLVRGAVLLPHTHSRLLHPVRDDQLLDSCVRFWWQNLPLQQLFFAVCPCLAFDLCKGNATNTYFDSALLPLLCPHRALIVHLCHPSRGHPSKKRA